MPNKSKNYLRKNLKKKSKNYLRKKLNKKVGGGTTNNKMRKKKQTKNIKKSKKKISQLGGTPAPITFFNSLPPIPPIAPPRSTLPDYDKRDIEKKLNDAFIELKIERINGSLIDTGIEGRFDESNIGKVYMKEFARGEYTEYIIFCKLILISELKDENREYEVQEYTFDILKEIFYKSWDTLKLYCDFLKEPNANQYTLYDSIKSSRNLNEDINKNIDIPSQQSIYTYIISIIEGTKRIGAIEAIED